MMIQQQRIQVLESVLVCLLRFAVCLWVWCCALSNTVSKANQHVNSYSSPTMNRLEKSKQLGRLILDQWTMEKAEFQLDLHFGSPAPVLSVVL